MKFTFTQKPKSKSRKFRYDNHLQPQKASLSDRRLIVKPMALSQVPSPLQSPDYKSWAESSYRDFEERYKISTTTPMPLIRQSMKDNFVYINPSLEKNMDRMAHMVPRIIKQEQADNYQPQRNYNIFKREHLNVQNVQNMIHIDKWYPNPTDSRAPNKLPLPMNYEFDIKQVLAQSYGATKITDAPNLFQGSDLQAQPIQKNSLVQQIADKIYSQQVKVYGSIALTTGNKPESREGASMILHDNKVYLFGGQSRLKHNDLRTLNISNWKWSIQSAQYKPKGTMGQSLISFKDKLMVFCGWSHYSQRLGIRRCHRRIYSVGQEGKWQRWIGQGQVPLPRRNQGAVRVGSTVLIYGGVSEYSKILKDLYCFQILSQKWYRLKSHGDQPKYRSHFSFTPVFTNKVLHQEDEEYSNIIIEDDTQIQLQGVYMFGGLNKENKATSNLYVLQIINGEYIWTQPHTQGFSPSARFDHSASLTQNYYVVFGGRNDDLFKDLNDSALGDVNLLNLRSMTWERIQTFGQMPEPRWGHSSCTFASKILILGGINHYGYLTNNIYVIETNQYIIEKLLEH